MERDPVPGGSPPFRTSPRGALSRVLDLFARARGRRSPSGSLAFAALFLGAAVLWARMPGSRPWVRHAWIVMLLVLAVRDFATGMRGIAERRGLGRSAWIAVTALFALVSFAAAFALASRG
jgi:hypothetical protein